MGSWLTGKVFASGLRFHYTRTGGDKQAAHISNAGHSIRREQFKAFVAVVQAFLA